MILVPISPGELLDKITILELKVQRLTQPDKLENAHRELSLLRAARAREVPQDSTLSALVAELSAVNALLWEVEDALRCHERDQDFDERFVELARAVYQHNDRRAALKRSINVHLGSALVEEKAYVDYRQRRGDVG